MLHNKLINRNDIETVFDCLSKEYESLGGNKKVEIYLVGGAAILLKFDYRLSTMDIDAYFDENDMLNIAIKNTSKKLELPLDWLNQDFTKTPSYSNKIIEKAKMVSQFGKYIFVYSIESKYLIAMKLKSSRPTGGDLDDIIMMIYEMRYKRLNISYEEIIEAYKELYPDFTNTYDYFLERTKNAFEIPVEDFEYLFNKH